MKKLMFALSFMLCFVYISFPYPAYSHTGTKSTKQNLTCMSYNIHWGVGMDNQYNLDRIFMDIQKSNADIIGLQEVDVHFGKRSNDDNQIEKLAQKLNMYYFFAPIYRLDPEKPSQPFREHGVAVLSRYPITRSWNHEITRLSTLEPEQSPKYRPGFAQANIQVDGKSVSIYVTHLDYRGDPTVRTKQISEMLNIIGPCKNQKILLGDLNATPDANELKPLFEKFNNPFVSCMGLCKSFPADNPHALIDYVLTCPKAPVKSVAVLTAKGSDHLPVVATISLNANN